APNGGGSGNGGGGSGAVFSAQVNFTGVVPIHGSFTDSSTASTGQSCSDYAANGLPFQAGWYGPNPAGGTVGGQALSVSPSVPYKDFHGAGTYTGNYFIALKIAATLFVTTSVTVTVNGDSSGSLTFANALAGDGSTESGTMTWTCANG
ncbi:MAG: hypothetical protein ACYCV4_19295, partial [Dermatophilaceae bacterium]